MAKYGSKQIPKIIRAFERAYTGAYGNIGDKAIKILQYNEAESDTTGRLKDSFSWATIKRSSGVGSNAESTDEVPKPSDDSVIIGTQTPYALSVDKGTQNQTFAYGQNGNPSSFAELVAKIKEWLLIKISKGKFQGDATKDVDSLARRIALDIVENGTDAHPFWEESKRDIVDTAKPIMLKAFSTELKKIPDATTEVGVRK